MRTKCNDIYQLLISPIKLWKVFVMEGKSQFTCCQNN